MTKPPLFLTLEEINRMSKEEFVANLGGIFEHSPWVAEGAYEHIPFHSTAGLHSIMLDTARNAEHSQVEALLRAHPDLATRLQVSPLSAAEQQGAGLDRLTPEEFARLTELNAAYSEKFRFPFILAVRGKNKDDIIQSIEARVNRSHGEEWEQALAEIGKITAFRLNDLIREKEA
ncbi:2-oxo-4-hydroxy-4-carboxy-5-ureidoimidazoline decarboxylase [Paenibacillus jilunlii]|uniref:2-oxo-4-hydroxy-4-carboxy-5-ureidoimidazoline decarboxylase n=1 Tax=Paenibacillus jilunlii TaxID=682956 RepID=A0A1G9LS39_9BACL|nr:2-oxo-4-hydroxy-4-carboxy-5-ureidoimidazoline decarboxylase [Paenibacillus jilunlii]KWX72402.1 OHCU decarboxylase [Paenibacillus jilunlii]SDL64295.1 2-oxo-4-hydroxy-4-carboxy-5-ureidoimidazoline decarboxylase [Paenibacillus jilunlii]